MQELQSYNRLSEKQQIEAVEERKQKKELKLEHSIIPHKGHKVWEINVKTLEVKPAEFMTNEIIDITKWEKMKDSLTAKRIQKKTGHVYISALNEKSALKRFKKNKGSAVIRPEFKRL